MTDVFSKRKRSEVMARIRGRNNRSTELLLAGLLRRAGLNGWRRHLPLPGRPDFAFVARRLAVFCDGCYWHGHKSCYKQPSTNVLYWRNKIAVNRRRDRRVTRLLRDTGWRVLRIWECTLNHNPVRSVQRITRAWYRRVRMQVQ